MHIYIYIFFFFLQILFFFIFYFYIRDLYHPRLPKETLKVSEEGREGQAQVPPHQRNGTGGSEPSPAERKNARALWRILPLFRCLDMRGFGVWSLLVVSRFGIRDEGRL